MIEGKHCECDNFSCDRLDNKLCSGNGVCSCGRCICAYGWKGDACQCRDTVQSCIPIGQLNNDLINLTHTHTHTHTCPDTMICFQAVETFAPVTATASAAPANATKTPKEDTAKIVR